MHMHAEIWVSTTEDVEGQVEKIMAPYSENIEGNNKAFWDWYQIGGRWKGEHVKGYDPSEDPEHIEECSLCKGTGRRPDAESFGPGWIEANNGCNGCQGKGVAVQYPTQWGPHEQDVMAVADAPDDLSSYTLVAKGKVFHKQVFNYDEEKGEGSFEETDYQGVTVKARLKELGIENGYLVTVDYHS